MIYGNQHTYQQLQTIITEMLHDESQETYPFIILAGPAHIGKASMLRQIIKDTDLNVYDVVTMQDLSDDWIALKDKNDLAGTSHSIQITVESKRQDIRMLDDTITHNWGVRELQSWLARSPIGSDKVVLIESLERATGGASNALLKTLEEPLPHRFMIATTNSLAQLPPTIVSRAMIFQVQVVTDVDMQLWVKDVFLDATDIYHNHILVLAAGRPGIIMHYKNLNILDEVVESRAMIQSQLQTGAIATLYQQMITAKKSGYLDIILDALLYTASQDSTLYDITLDLLSKQSSNVNMDNLLFEWCLRVKK